MLKGGGGRGETEGGDECTCAPQTRNRGPRDSEKG